jgi:SAM-dependent methyltransferase
MLCTGIVELYHFPSDLEQLIDEIAGEAIDTRRLAEKVLELSDVFVGRAPWQADYSRSSELRNAYLRYYLPVNLPKIRVPLAEWLRDDPNRLAGRTLRCLDLGSGPGTALLGLLDFLRDLPSDARPAAIEAVALDQSYENLKTAEALLQRLAARLSGTSVRFRPLRLDLVADREELFSLAAADGRFEIVIAENVICEIVRESGLERAGRLIEAAADRVLAPHGALVIVEPALRETARDLHRLRDRWLASGLHVYAPCLHEAHCPALATERDWCIADLAWNPPYAVAEIDRRSGLRKGSLKFAYLVLGREPIVLPGSRWRVVSDVLDLKGERRVYLCAEGRWIVLAQLKRDRGENAETLARLERGDLVETTGLERKGSVFRLPAGARLRRIADPISTLRPE